MKSTLLYIKPDSVCVYTKPDSFYASSLRQSFTLGINIHYKILVSLTRVYTLNGNKGIPIMLVLEGALVLCFWN